MNYQQIILLIVSIFTLYYIIRKIRKSQVLIFDMIFWIIFMLLLIILSIFPALPRLGADLIGIASSSNFLFLFVIFILLIKVFLSSIKISQLESKIKDLSQAFAIKENMESLKSKENNNANIKN